ncbi:hypothetical protein D3C86_993500 [compost metagenome]
MVSLMACMPPMVLATAASPAFAASLLWKATWLAWPTLPATCWMLAASSEMELEVWVTAAASSSDCPRTRFTLVPRRWTLLSTDWRLAAISSIAAEVSSALEAWTEVVSPRRALAESIWTAPALTEPAAVRTRSTTSRRLATILAIALPNWSRSLLGTMVRVRSPRLMASATPATSLR